MNFFQININRVVGSVILTNLNFTSCDELRLHGVNIPAYFNILGNMQYCTSWSKLIVLIWWSAGANPTKLSSSLMHNFSVFTIKLGHFIILYIFKKHSSLTAKIGKQSKTKSGRIDYLFVHKAVDWRYSYNRKSNLK